MQLDQVLKDRNLTSGELNKVIGLYNSRNYKNEIEIQAIDGTAFITMGECFSLETFVKEELLSTDEFARKANMRASQVETMLQECGRRGDIPSNAYISALTMDGKYYIHEGYLERFQERFSEFETYITEHEEEVIEEDLEFGLPGSTGASKQEDEPINNEPEEEEEEEEEEDFFDDEEDDEEAAKKEKKEREQKKRREEFNRLEQENRLAETRRQIAEAQIRAQLEEANREATTKAKAIEVAAETAARELVKAQEQIRRDFERVSYENKRQEEYKREELFKEEERKRAEDLQTHQSKVAEAMGSAYRDGAQSTQPTVQTASFSFSEAERERYKEEIRRAQEEVLRKANETAMANDIAMRNEAARREAEERNRNSQSYDPYKSSDPYKYSSPSTSDAEKREAERRANEQRKEAEYRMGQRERERMAEQNLRAEQQRLDAERARNQQGGQTPSGGNSYGSDQYSKQPENTYTPPSYSEPKREEYKPVGDTRSPETTYIPPKYEDPSKKDGGYSSQPSSTYTPPKYEEPRVSQPRDEYRRGENYTTPQNGGYTPPRAEEPRREDTYRPTGSDTHRPPQDTTYTPSRNEDVSRRDNNYTSQPSSGYTPPRQEEYRTPQSGNTYTPPKYEEPRVSQPRDEHRRGENYTTPQNGGYTPPRAEEPRREDTYKPTGSDTHRPPQDTTYTPSRNEDVSRRDGGYTHQPSGSYTPPRQEESRHETPRSDTYRTPQDTTYSQPKHEESKQPNSSYVPPVTTGRTNTTEDVRRTITTEHNAPHTTNHNNSVEGARQDSIRHEEPKREEPRRHDDSYRTPTTPSEQARPATDMHREPTHTSQQGGGYTSPRVEDLRKEGGSTYAQQNPVEHKNEEYKQPSSAYVPPVTTGKTNTTEELHRTITTEHNAPRSTNYNNSVEGARQDSVRHEESRPQTHEQPKTETTPAREYKTQTSHVVIDESGNKYASVGSGEYRRIDNNGSQVGESIKYEDLPKHRPAESYDYGKQPETTTPRAEHQTTYTQPNQPQHTSTTEGARQDAYRAPEVGGNRPVSDSFARDMSQQPKIEVATVQTISGNNYVVPESKRERFEELKSIVESPGKTPVEVRNELKGFEQYNAKSFENVGSAVSTPQPHSEPSKPESGSKPFENITVTGKTNTTTDVQRTITTERQNPAHTTNNNSVDSARQDALRQQPKQEEKPATTQTKVDTSKIVLVTVDGKSVMQAPATYADSIKNTIAQGNSGGLRGATTEDELIRTAIATGMVIDEGLKVKSGSDYFVTGQGLHAMATARDLTMMELRLDARDDAAVHAGGVEKYHDNIRDAGRRDAMDDAAIHAGGVEKYHDGIRDAGRIDALDDAKFRTDGTARPIEVINTAQAQNSLDKIAAKITVSGMVQNVTAQDYQNGRLNQNVRERMDDAFDANSKTEGHAVRSNHNVVSTGQNEHQKVIGNMAGTQANQQIKTNGKNGAEGPAVNPATATQMAEKINGQNIITINGSKSNANTMAGIGQAISKAQNEDRATTVVVDKNRGAHESADDYRAGAGKAVDLKQSNLISAAYVKVDWAQFGQTLTDQTTHAVEREMRQSQTFRGAMTIVDSTKAVLEIADGLTFGAMSNTMTLSATEAYIKAGAQGTFILKGQAKNAAYVSLSAQIRHAQHNLNKVNKILEKEEKLAEAGKNAFVNKDKKAFRIDASLGMSVKHGKKIIDFDKNDKGQKMLDDYLLKNGIQLTGKDDSDHELQIALLITELQNNGNSKALIKALQQRTGIQGLDHLTGLRKTYDPKSKSRGFTTDAIINADKVISSYLNKKLGFSVRGMSAKQLRDLASQITDEDVRTMLLSYAGLKNIQQGMKRVSFNQATDSIGRLLRNDVSSNETFAGYYKMSDTVRQIKKIAKNSVSLTTKIIRHLQAKRGKVLDKKLAKIDKKLSEGKGNLKKLQRRRDSYAAERQGINDKFKKREDRARAKAEKQSKKAEKQNKNREKRKERVDKVKNKFKNSRAGQWIGNKRAAFATRLKNNKFVQKISKPFKAIGKVFKGAGEMMKMLMKILQAIMKVIKTIIMYVIYAIAIILAIILLSNAIMYLVGTFGNSIAELLGQQKFTDGAAGKSLVVLQKYDKAFFAAEDAVMMQLQSTNLQETVEQHYNWFIRWVTAKDEVWGFIVPANNENAKNRYEIKYSGLPYNSADGGQFQQIYYDGWYAENGTENIITRYSNAKDILCVANAVYGGEINKYWDDITGAFGGGTSNYCKQLWANTHFCGECSANIVPGDASQQAICIHTTPLYACEKGYCWGTGSAQNTWKYYCNYNNTEATNDQKATRWLYNNKGFNGLWDGVKEIDSTSLNSGSSQKNVNKYLCVVGVSTKGVAGSLNADNQATYTLVSTDAGYAQPYTLYGKKVQKSSNFTNLFKNDSYIWPTKSTSGSGNISCIFGARNLTGKVEFHSGIDIGDAMGTEVYAIASGKVTQVVSGCTNNGSKNLATFTGNNCCYLPALDASGNPKKDAHGNIIYEYKSHGAAGNLVVITHDDGSKSRYLHLSEVKVSVGDTVNQGKLIGKVGSTGRSSGAHLHFEFHTKGGSVVDPMLLYGGYTYGITNASTGATGNGAGCVRNFCKEDTSKKQNEPVYVDGVKITKDVNGNKIGWYKWVQTWNSNKDCTTLEGLKYHTSSEMSECTNSYNVKHSDVTKTSKECSSTTRYYECDGLHMNYCRGDGPDDGYSDDWVANSTMSPCSNSKIGDSGNYWRCLGHKAGAKCHSGALESWCSESYTFNGKRYCGGHWRYDCGYYGTSTKCPDGRTAVYDKSVCNGHTVCGGHNMCKGHYVCPGHDLAYCTGHTNLFTKTVIIGLNEYSGTKYQTDLMYNATLAKYTQLKTNWWTPTKTDLNYGSSFSLKEYKIALAARSAYEEDWADMYDIVFYQENTPFKLTTTEMQSVILQQEHFRNKEVAQLALLSVGRVGYHDKYSTTADAKYQKLDISLEDNLFFAQYEQFAVDISGTHGSDTGGRIMSGLNNETFVGYILWSAGAKSSFLKTKASITSGMSNYWTPKDAQDVINNVTKVKCGDIVVFNYPDAKGNMTPRIGIVTTINTNQSDEAKALGYGSIGVVSCISEQSDAVYLVFTANTVGNKNKFGFTFYSY